MFSYFFRSFQPTSARCVGGWWKRFKATRSGDGGTSYTVCVGMEEDWVRLVLPNDVVPPWSVYVGSVGEANIGYYFERITAIAVERPNVDSTPQCGRYLLGVF